MVVITLRRDDAASENKILTHDIAHPYITRSVMATIKATPMKRPVIVACARTPIGRAHKDKGWFRNVRSDDLATTVVKAIVERSGIDPKEIDDLVLGLRHYGLCRHYAGTSTSHCS